MSSYYDDPDFADEYRRRDEEALDDAIREHEARMEIVHSAVIGNSGAREFIKGGGWRPSDPCSSCGSSNTVYSYEKSDWIAHCRNCGRYDDDE